MIVLMSCDTSLGSATLNAYITAEYMDWIGRCYFLFPQKGSSKHNNAGSALYLYKIYID